MLSAQICLARRHSHAGLLKVLRCSRRHRGCLAPEMRTMCYLRRTQRADLNQHGALRPARIGLQSAYRNGSPMARARARGIILDNVSLETPRRALC